MSTHEVITIQAGPYANFIGAHWWNMQEASFCYTKDEERPLDINHDVLFREGVNHQGQFTFTPRLLIINTKSGMGNLSRIGPLYGEELSAGIKETNQWDGSTELMVENPEKKSYQNCADRSQLLQKHDECSSIELDNISEEYHNTDPKLSDFFNTHLHPRSICLLDDYYNVANEKNFDSYDCGLEAVTYKPNQEIIEDVLRKYVEECDYLQGFQIIADGDNGFSAVSSSLMQHLVDEYGKKCRIGFPVFGKNEQHDSSEEKTKLLNRLYSSLIGLNNFSSLSSLFSPLTLSSDLIDMSDSVQFPLLNYKCNSLYHTSSILATALENITSSYRLKKWKCLMPDVVESLVLYGRKLMSTGLCLPLNVEKDFTSTYSTASSSYSIQPITPCFKPEETALAQLAVLRGIPNSHFKKAHAHPYLEVNKEDMFGQYLIKYAPSELMFVDVFEEKCFIPKTFPDIFGDMPNLGRHDFALKGVRSMAVTSSLSNSNNAADMLEQLLSMAKKYQSHLTFSPFNMYIEKDDFFEALHDLITLKECYSFN